jgi:hypothetical protein
MCLPVSTRSVAALTLKLLRDALIRFRREYQVLPASFKCRTTRASCASGLGSADTHSSPHARGAQRESVRVFPKTGLIPACAGNNFLA